MGIYAEKVFPWLVERALDKPSIHERRARVVQPAEGDVLEIGFGTGATLPYYDRLRVRSLSVVEPSSGMNMRARERIESLGWQVKLLSLEGESLPYADEAFDCVVSCLPLCTVGDPRRVLSEVYRVLRPGGSFRFFEHVASADAKTRRWQNRLNPLHKVVGVGCNRNRDTVALVREAGFQIAESPHQFEPTFALAKFMPVVEAEARKPGV